jgi:hypothetical protein
LSDPLELVDGSLGELLRPNDVFVEDFLRHRDRVT